MTEHPHTVDDRHFLPPMGRRWLLPLYDPLTRLGGMPRVHAGLLDRAGIRPGHRVLEIGCGNGIAATLVCERLEDGSYTGVDRSRAMVEAASRRNRRFVDEGRAEFLLAHLEDLGLGERRFDLVFAVRVAIFHRDPGRARALVEPWLAEGGRVEAFYDDPRSSVTPVPPSAVSD